MTERPTGAVFILRKASGTLLIELRDDKSPAYPNTWVFPGGGMDENETYVATAMREAKEELGVDLVESDCTLVAVYSTPGFVEDNHVFVCSVPEDQRIELMEGADARWIEPSELLELQLGYQQEVFIPDLLKFLGQIKN